jgi:hypothetical protein
MLKKNSILVTLYKYAAKSDEYEKKIVFPFFPGKVDGHAVKLNNLKGETNEKARNDV